MARELLGFSPSPCTKTSYCKPLGVSKTPSLFAFSAKKACPLLISLAKSSEALPELNEPILFNLRFKINDFGLSKYVSFSQISQLLTHNTPKEPIVCKDDSTFLEHLNKNLDVLLTFERWYFGWRLANENVKQ